MQQIELVWKREEGKEITRNQLLLSDDMQKKTNIGTDEYAEIIF